MSVEKKKKKKQEQVQFEVYLDGNILRIFDPTTKRQISLDAVQLYRFLKQCLEGGKLEYVRTVKRQTKKVMDAIKEIWKDKDKIGTDWISTFWFLKKQLEEIKERKFTADVMINEYADCIIIITKFFMNLGLDPEKVVLRRLNERHRGRVDEIIEKYNKKREEEQNASKES